MKKSSDWTSNPDLLAAAGVAAALVRAGLTMRLSVNGQQLLITGPAGAVTPDLAAQIREHRREMLILASFLPQEGFTPATEPVEVRERRWRILDGLYADLYGSGLSGLPVSLAVTPAGNLRVTMADGSSRIERATDDAQ